jgi:hypothetical protein
MRANKAEFRCDACSAITHALTTGDPSSIKMRCGKCAWPRGVIEWKLVDVEVGADGVPRQALKPGEVQVPVGVGLAHVEATIIKKDGRRIELGVLASNDPAHPVTYKKE